MGPEQCQRVVVRPAAMTPARRIVIGLLLQGLAREPECVFPGDGERGVGVIVVSEGDQVRSGEQAVGHLLDPWRPGPERPVWPLHERVRGDVDVHACFREKVSSMVFCWPYSTAAR